MNRTGEGARGVETSMVSRCLAYAALVVCSSALSLLPAQAQTRAVLELFTSQGCSSCPAADKLLAELAADPTLVPLSLPIDYWDYLGWKDTLSDPLHTMRQKLYSKARGDRQVYTPQMVVNGSVHALGSDRAAIERAIAQTRQNAALSVPMSISAADGRLQVAASGSDGQRGEVWVAGLATAITVAIGRGENRGKTITYHNVARRWVKLGPWSGNAESWIVPLRDIAGADIDRAAVLLQTGSAERPSLILGAALTSLPK
jgi:hypothetical protein